MNTCIEQPQGYQQSLRAALEYAVDWAVFPATPDAKKSYKSKARSGSNWGMTSDPDQIPADFARRPNARVGIPVNGIIIIDVDTLEGHGVDGTPGTGSQTRQGLRLSLLLSR
jgi:hypothetical protein